MAPKLPDLFRRAATTSVKILKGAKTGRLPGRAAQQVGAYLNLTTGRLLGLTVRREFLLRADQVIE